MQTSSGPKEERLTLTFHDIKREDIPLAGGKGANLGEMYNARFPVPPGFIVTALTYKKFIEETGIKKEMQEFLKDLNVDDNDALQKASKNVQTVVRAEPIPQYIQDAIKNSYEEMYLNKYQMPSQASELINSSRDPPFVAVRSSATAEDLPSASFAGQQATYLNVKGAKGVIEAVRDCWASLFTARAIFYRAKNNFDHFDVLIAVVVQKMADSTKAGVAFSVDPTTGGKKIIIEGAFGLGESVVSGSVNPDHYEVDKESWEITDIKVMHKESMIIRDPSGKNKKIELEDPKRSSQVLPEEEIIQLAKMIKMIEDHYQAPQDIEWAFEGKKMFIVQSRPITTIKEKKQGPEEKAMESAGEALLTGLPASQGIISGTVQIINSLDELGKIQQGEILVTKMTDPDFVPAMQRASAIVTDQGGMTSHAAIVSREMGIPCIVGTEFATKKLKDGDIITVDATRGHVYMGKVELKMESQEAASGAEKPKIPIEKIETKTKIYMNLGIPEKIEDYKDLPIDGIGLMRLEFIIADDVKAHPLNMIKENRSDEYVNILVEKISKVASAIKPRPVVVRFSDFKSNEYHNLKGGEEFEPKEDNPMIGWRGISRYVSEKFEPAFRLECKAIKKLRDSGLTNVWVMLPFARNTSEIKKALKIMQSEGLERDDDFKVWIMAEVPAVAIMPEEFAQLPIDGASIGSNDLTQLTLGVDRDSSLLGKMGYFDERNAAVLHAIKRIIQGFKKHGKTVSLCGQAPSVYPEFAEFLVMLGITSISVNPDVVESVKRRVEGVESKQKFSSIAHDDEEL